MSNIQLLLNIMKCLNEDLLAPRQEFLTIFFLFTTENTCKSPFDFRKSVQIVEIEFSKIISEFLEPLPQVIRIIKIIT